MIIQLQNTLSTQELSQIQETVRALGLSPNPVKTQFGHYLVCIAKQDFDLRKIGGLAGVKDIHRVSDQYKLVSSKWKVGPTQVEIGEGIHIGGDFQIMAGPCSIENEDQVKDTVAHLKKNGVKIMRGGVYKPRSSPYSFRGLGQDGLKMFHQVCSEAGIRIVTEVMMPGQIEAMYDYVDIFQVGARNAQNFNLLDELGAVDKPILLKRGFSNTIEELLQAAEYIFSNGNERIILCERGIRTYEKAYRNTLDLNAVPILKEKSHLPVVVDPSHGIGIRRHVPDLALAATLVGADGVIVEVHREPEKAFSDGQQTLSYAEAEKLYRELREVAAMRIRFSEMA